ncbi:MAG: methionine biosynthesis protein MetW [Candidatus Omnitrophica bacterium]|nr:methionine biosynthesis protein MetW [Candidatus Omnitrophota bacterium]MDD5437335.1 methionine biosynthesis protein MetW [Candidatus Omnitrophota bacterium]
MDRLDYKIISNLIEPNSKVLDLGCGDGELMLLLTKERKVRAQGIELDDSEIYKCVEKGLSVFHGDIDSGLLEYPDKSFDYVILNQTMQQAKKADFVIQEALRVGKRLIVGFPNFAYFKARISLFFKGKTPITKSLPYYWYDTPNLHFLTISDFKDYCKKKNIRILRSSYTGHKKSVRFWPNLFALNAIFLMER